MKVVVNPEFIALKGFVENVLSHSYNASETYRAFRNIVEDVTADGVRMVVKRFRKPTEFNRVVYTFIRPTKAKRSYNYSLRLKSMGIDVPAPIGYVEKKKGLFFHTGCYISLYTDYRSVKDFESPEKKDQMEQFLKEFTDFVVDFHSKKLVHNDFNVDNILYKVIDGHYRFQLIDLNRVQFNNHSLNKCAKDISSIHFDKKIMDKVISDYCRLRSIDLEKFTRLVENNRNHSKRVSHIKDIILGPLGLRKSAQARRKISQ